ncbi:hypothetical protein SAMN04487880_0600 [Marinobacter sp. es.042]|uniref:hypothetical protein n=1 Tax=Marinobacter sp. es.042 TaxID=1761794 RepID=UPI000B503E44|nr:hypothetical protein [Marinobacter sp. es.042]SNB54889.1 hypothetical protein SAMN04487880_0600 [Marinobacter sp. es.042]
MQKNFLKRSSENYFETTSKLNYDLASTKWRQLEKTSKSKLPSALEGILRLFAKLIGSFKYRQYPAIKSDVVFVVGSRNNFKALDPVRRSLGSASVIGYNGNTSLDEHIPELWFYLSSLIHLPKFLLAYLACDDRYVRWTMRCRIDRYLLAFSSVRIWTGILKRSSCKVLVISNDHVVWSRSAIYAAKDLGIKTVFIPHAPTGEHPPDLIFDFALFDGVHQYQKYRYDPQSSTRCAVIGAIRYERFVSVSDQVGNGVLVCFNSIDSEKFVHRIISELAKLSPDRPIFIRPHPADLRRHQMMESLAGQFGLHYCRPESDIIDQLRKVKVVFAGLSGVHVDGIMAGRKAVTLEEWYEGDYYGLKRAGLLSVVGSISDLTEMLAEGTPESASVEALAALNWHKSGRSPLPSYSAARLIEGIARGAVTLEEQVVEIPPSRLKFQDDLGVHYAYEI